MKQRCGEFDLSKAGTIQALRERLVCHFMSSSTSKTLEAWSHKPETESATPAASPPKAQDSPPATASAGEAPDPAEMVTTAAQESETSRNGAGPSNQGSVLTHSQCVDTPVRDLTHFFGDLEVGPALPTDEEKSMVEIIRAADVVLPVAALVKVLHGFIEDPDVAVLLAGLNASLHRLHSSGRKLSQVYVHICIHMHIYMEPETPGIETGFREDMSGKLISFLVVCTSTHRRKKEQGRAQELFSTMPCT